MVGSTCDNMRKFLLEFNAVVSIPLQIFNRDISHRSIANLADFTSVQAQNTILSSYYPSAYKLAFATLLLQMLLHFLHDLIKIQHPQAVRNIQIAIFIIHHSESDYVGKKHELNDDQATRTWNVNLIGLRRMIFRHL